MDFLSDFPACKEKEVNGGIIRLMIKNKAQTLQP